MKISFDHMSEEELQFIKLYCHLLRRQYYSVKAVMAIMRPSELNVASPVKASKVANGLTAFGEDFEARIDQLRTKHKMRTRLFPHDEVRFLNELADIFALSFFKLVAYESDDAEQISLIKDGWCSGEPTSWAKQMDLSASHVSKQQQNIMSKIVNFFSSITAWKNPTLNYKPIKTDDEWDDYEEDDEWYENE